MNLLAARDPQNIKRLKSLQAQEFQLNDYSNVNLTSLKLMNYYMKSNLGADFEPALGAPHMEAPGKYRKAQVYFFEFEGHEMACKIEKGGRGTGWFLLSAQQSFSLLNIASPELKEWFPRFLCELHQQVYGVELPSEAFTGDNYQTITAWRDKAALTEQVPTSTKVAKPAKKI